MGSLLVVLIVLGCAAFQYLKGTVVKSFAAVITSICACIVAFGYFELLANVLIEREILMPWSHVISFVLLFILAFAILQTIAVQLIRQPVDMGLWPERLGRVIFGILLGLIVSGFLLTAASIAPLPANYPYQRFSETSPDTENPSRVLLNADGFTTGWFNMISSGSFRGKRSFAALHPAFLDQLFLNRHEISKGVSSTISSGAITIPKQAVWPAPEGLKDLEGKTELSKSGYKLTIVRLCIKYQAVKRGGGVFTPSQLRLVCRQENEEINQFFGKTRNVYPVGYIQTANKLQTKELTSRIEIKDSDFIGGANVKEIDFAFYVPDGFVPVLIQFKQNSINQLPPPVTADQAPSAVPFTAPPERTENIAQSPAKDNNTVEDAAKGN